MKYTSLAIAGIITLTSLSLPSASFADSSDKTQNYTINEKTSITKFTDTKEIPSWAIDSFNYLVNKGAITGRPDGRFAPNESMDRGSLAVILTKIMGLNVDYKAQPTFPDSQNHWAGPYIATLQKQGTINGDENGNFNPNANITRAAVAKMIDKGYKMDGISGSTMSEFDLFIGNRFGDVKGHWAMDSVVRLFTYGLTSGSENSMWYPDKEITRAEASVLLANTDKFSHTDFYRIGFSYVYIDRKTTAYSTPTTQSPIKSVYQSKIFISNGIKKVDNENWIRIHGNTGTEWIKITTSELEELMSNGKTALTNLD
ncbi:S-layer homology domain-containing protein [Bacillus cereus]|uniref:S-layer homology domain-containing protein n=1 Tax=Bacillus cereus TaxID=1396 RepID=UPI00187A86A7|nr:S-layer homology domain-containing protein [Bacillus cereus]MBE7122197.1 S-layer homology domain-containing protein [Bacillus cereus]